MGARVIEKMNRTITVQREMVAFARDLIAKACFDTQALAQQRVRVDTGAAKNSIYVSIQGRSTYNEGIAQTLQARPGATVLPEEKPTGSLEGIVSVGVDYGAPLEFRYPYMLPAFNTVAAGLTRVAEAMARRTR